MSETRDARCWASSWLIPGSGDGLPPCPVAARRKTVKKRRLHAGMKPSVYALGLRLQLHVERRRLAAADLHVGQVPDEAALAHLDVVAAFRQVDQLPVLALNSPRRAVHQHVGVAWLHPQRERAAAVFVEPCGGWRQRRALWSRWSGWIVRWRAASAAIRSSRQR